MKNSSAIDPVYISSDLEHSSNDEMTLPVSKLRSLFVTDFESTWLIIIVEELMENIQMTPFRSCFQSCSAVNDRRCSFDIRSSLQ